MRVWKVCIPSGALIYFDYLCIGHNFSFQKEAADPCCQASSHIHYKNIYIDTYIYIYLDIYMNACITCGIKA